MPPLPDALRRLAALPSLVATKATRSVALQLTLGAICVLGAVAWATGSLFASVEPPRPEPPRPKIVFSRLDDWPEIKNGVPDLKRAASVPALAVDASPPPPEARLAPAPETPAAILSDAPPAPPAVGTSIGQLSGFQPTPASVAAGAAPPSAAGEGAHAADPAETRPTGAPAAEGAAPSLRPPSPPAVASVDGERRTSPGETAGPRRQSRGGGRIDVDAQPRPPAAPQRKVGAATRNPDAKPTRASTQGERKRVAAASAPPSEAPPVADGPAATDAQAAPEGERVRVLGCRCRAGESSRNACSSSVADRRHEASARALEAVYTRSR
jgi:hypothetical protein